MTTGASWQLVDLIGALVLGWALFAERRVRASTYSCPVCGARRRGGHSKSCPWRREEK
jgi:hypothetical protein